MSTYRIAVEREIAEGSRPTRVYFTMSALAAVLAAYGLLANSPAVIIGAMLVAMLLNPITGLSMALVTGDWPLIQRAALAEILGAVMVFSIGCLIGWGNRELPLTAEMLSRTDPSLIDLVIAIVGGVAASYALGNERLNSALAGVAIATALVPPLVDSGILLAHGEFHLALGAFLLYASNYASIVFAAMAVFWLLGHRPQHSDVHGQRWARVARSLQLLLFVALAVHLVIRFNNLVAERAQSLEVEARLQTGLAAIPGARLMEVRIAPHSAPEAIVATVRVPKALTPQDVASLEAGLSAEVRGGLHLRVRSVPVVVTEATGYLFQDTSP